MSIQNSVAMAKNRNWGMAAAEATPRRLFPLLYNAVTDEQVTLGRAQRGFWRLELPHRTVTLPQARAALRLTHIGDRPERRVYDQYTMSEVFEPARGDTVVDVGAHIGEFSWWVQRHRDPGTVVAIDPDPRAQVCLKHNLGDECLIEEVAASNEDGETMLNFADDASESGLLTPDVGNATQIPVKQRRLDSLIDSVDFLKVEAEGFEPEVLTGLGDLFPQRIVVNVSAERNGVSPVDECESMLQRRGYDTKRVDHHLFADADGACCV